MSKFNATLMILLMALSAFAGMAPLPLVGADSANNGNDAADTEATATVIPMENTWFEGHVDSGGTDPHDFYQIEVHPNDQIEIQITGFAGDFLHLDYRLSDQISYDSTTFDSSSIEMVILSNTDPTAKTLYMDIYPEMPDINYPYCFQVYHHSNTSQPPAEECFAPAPAASTISVGSVVNSGVGYFWTVSFENLTDGNDVVVNWTLMHEDAFYDSGTIEWTNPSADNWEDILFNDGLVDGEWCMSVTMWEQSDNGDSNSEDFDCSTIDTASTEPFMDIVGGLIWPELITEGGVEGAQVAFWFEGGNIPNDDYMIEWDYFEYPWEGDYADQGVEDLSPTSEHFTLGEDGATLDIMTNFSIGFVEVGCYSITFSLASADTLDTIILLTSDFDVGDSCDNTGSEWITFDFSNHESNVVEHGEGVEGEFEVGNMEAGVTYYVTLTVWRDDGTLFQTHSYVEDTTFTFSDANALGIYNNAENGDWIPLASGDGSGEEWDMSEDCFYAIATLYGNDELIIDTLFEFSVHTTDCDYHYSSTGNEEEYCYNSYSDSWYDYPGAVCIGFWWGVEDAVSDEPACWNFETNSWDVTYDYSEEECNSFIWEPEDSEENSWCAQLEGFAGAVWDSLFTYSPGDVVEYPANSGLFYRAKSTTSGDLPDENTDAWEGPCTCADIWAGEHWIDTTSYPEYLVVEFNGEFWISLMPGNLGNVPSISPEYWRPCEGDETNPCAQHGGTAGPVYDQTKQYYMKGEIVEYPANSGVFYISNYDYSTSHPSNGRWTKCTCSEIHDGTQYQSGTSYPDWKVVEHAGELYIRTPTTWIYTQGDPEPEQTKFWWLFWRVCSPEGCEQESVGQYDSANWAIYDVDVVVQHPPFSGKYWRSQMEDNTNTPPSHWARCFRESIGDDDHTVPDMTVLPWDPDSEVVDTWVDKDHAMARYGGADVMVLGPPESKGPGDPLQGVIISLSTATDPECDDVTGPSDPLDAIDIGSAAECDGEFEIEAYPGDRLTFAGETCNGLSDRGLDSTQTTCEDKVVLIPRRYLPDADDGVLARDIGGHLMIEASGCWVGEVSDDAEGPTDPISGIDWRAECPPRGDGESKPVLTMDRVPAIIVGECAMEHMEDIGVFLPEDERPAQEFGRVDSVSSTTADDGGDIAARSISGRGPGDPIIDMDIGRIVTLDSSDESRFCGARLVVRDSDVQGPSDPISSLDIGSILDIPDNAGTYFEIDGEEYFVWNVLGMTCAAIHAPGMDCEDAIVRLGDATVEDPDDVQGPTDPISGIDIGSNADCDSGTTSEAEGLDSDCDGVPNAWDDCPDTSSDAVGTDRNGCDITAETVTEAADSGTVPGFLAIFSMVAMVAAAVAMGRTRDRSANRR